MVATHRFGRNDGRAVVLHLWGLAHSRRRSVHGHLFPCPVIGWAWLATSIFALVVTVNNLWDAWSSRAGLRGSGKVREYVAGENARREAVRVVINAALIVLVVPALLRGGDVPLSPYVVVAMLIPVGMALNSYLDRQARRTVDRMLAVVDGQ